MKKVAPSLDLLESSTPLPFNRRVAIRYPCGLATATSVALDPAFFFRRVRVHNISTSGIGLFLKDPPQKGTQVYIRMKNQILNFTYDLCAHAVHAVQQEEGKWLVGFSFVRELTLGELASLL